MPIQQSVAISWNNTLQTLVDVVYTFVPVGDNGCEGDAFTVTVTVNPEPVGIASTKRFVQIAPFDFDPQDNITTWRETLLLVLLHGT